METCALFPLFRLKASLEVWQESYCEDTFVRCARFQRMRDGKETPVNLLPNGSMLTVTGGPGGGT
jgi:hypothetical protein